MKNEIQLTHFKIVLKGCGLGKSIQNCSTPTYLFANKSFSFHVCGVPISMNIRFCFIIHDLRLKKISIQQSFLLLCSK